MLKKKPPPYMGGGLYDLKLLSKRLIEALLLRRKFILTYFHIKVDHKVVVMPHFDK